MELGVIKREVTQIFLFIAYRKRKNVIRDGCQRSGGLTGRRLPVAVCAVHISYQTKSGSRILYEDKYIEARDIARYGSHPGASHPGPGRAKPERETQGHPPVGPPPAGGTVRDRCKEDCVSDEGGALSGPIPGCLGWL
ncbi:hypothetical protein CRENBAI_005323 [Crenichthys baileyi]|uniref:Uncharacterized protein n=1 Tax=Crenichthys baileyi TaxID=28760 RepID=A0AAV9RGH2_9TELE